METTELPISKDNQARIIAELLDINYVSPDVESVELYLNDLAGSISEYLTEMQ